MTFRKGITAQKLTSALLRNVNALKNVDSATIINQGIDGGREFSFEVQSSDGAMFIVTVHQEKESDFCPFDLKRKTTATKWVDNRDQIVLEQQRKAVERREEKRRKFLGE